MAELWTASDAGSVLRMPTAVDDKYSRGVLGVRTGSTSYPGAAVLGVEAAWRTGLGMVRYLGPATPTSLVLQRRPETVAMDGRVQAWVCGSGTDPADRSDAETTALRSILSGTLPVVVDAGALDLAVGARAPRIVTPHDREHARLRAALLLPALPSTSDAGPRARSAAETAQALGATVLLKGAVTVIVSPGGRSIRVEAGSPWLATAGTGDVLAGVIGAVLAGVCATAEAAHTETGDLAEIAATGAWLHGRAAVLAAEAAAAGHGTGPITALDVADHVPRAVAEALAAAGGSSSTMD